MCCWRCQKYSSNAFFIHCNIFSLMKSCRLWLVCRMSCAQANVNVVHQCAHAQFNSIQLCLEAKTVGDLNLVSVYGEPYLWISSIVSKHTFGGIHTVYRLGLTRTINIFLIPVFCLHFVFAHESLWFTPLVLFLQTSEPKTHSHVQVRLNRFNFLSYFSFNQLGLTSTDRIRKELLLFILGFSNTVLFEINVRVLTCRQVMHGFVFQQVVAIFLFDA